jgi:chemotaxis protein CheX
MPVYAPKAEHVNPFISATITSFSTMVGVEVVPNKPFLKKGSGVNYDISGVIGLSGEAKGSVILSFPQDSVVKIVSSFLGETITEMNNDVTDAVGELANIIAGSAKKDLAAFKLNISLPTVIMGTEHRIFDPKDVMSMIVPFTFDGGNFDLGVNLKSL